MLFDKVKKHLNIKSMVLDYDTYSFEEEEEKINEALSSLSNYCIDIFINAGNSYSIPKMKTGSNN